MLSDQGNVYRLHPRVWGDFRSSLTNERTIPLMSVSLTTMQQKVDGCSACRTFAPLCAYGYVATDTMIFGKRHSSTLSLTAPKVMILYQYSSQPHICISIMTSITSLSQAGRQWTLASSFYTNSYIIQYFPVPFSTLYCEQLLIPTRCLYLPNTYHRYNSAYRCIGFGHISTRSVLLLLRLLGSE